MLKRVIRAPIVVGALLIAAFFVPISNPLMAEEFPYWETSLSPRISSYSYGDNTSPYSTLTNQDLVLRASHLRTGHADTPRQIGEEQWLSPDGVETIEGQKAVSRLLERRLKDYIYSTESSQWLKQRLLPAQNGANFIKDVNYDLKLRSDEFVFGLVYEF